VLALLALLAWVHTLGNGHLEVLVMMKMMPLVDDDRKMEYDPLLIGEYISL
jgi:hypothetical protein